MCVSPLKGFQIGVNPSGKPDYKITSYSVDHIELFKGNWQKVYSDFVSPFASKIVRNSIDIPCGHCVECRLNYSKQWADRLMLEAKDYDENYFLTLTYDNVHLPVTDCGLMTLRPDDLQLFLKRLRRKVEPDIIRFFACGEYGDQSNRPHYHAIVFNLHIPDLCYYGKSTEHPIFISDFINNIWKNGHVIIAPVNWQTCAYTARYCMKKTGGKSKEYYDQIGVEPEFLRMSRRPGIASRYFDDNYQKIYVTDELILSDEHGGRRSKPPRFFDKKLEVLNVELYEFIKNRRREIAEINKKNLLLQTKLTYEEILKNRALKMNQKAFALKRQL